MEIGIVIARSHATKQSMPVREKMDCVAPLAMTVFCISATR
jgi:hypothetical protein